jgi:hypothetical protein
MRPVSQSDLVGTTDAAAILGWSRAKVKRLAQKGDLPFAHKMPGTLGAYLFHRGVIEFIAKRDAPVERAS